MVGEAGADAQGAAAGHGVDGVQHQVGDDLVQLGGTPHHHRHRPQLELELERDAALDLPFLPARPGDRERVADHLVHVHGDERLVLPDARELLHASHRFRAAVGRLLDDVDAPLHHVDVARAAPHQLGVAEDGLQEVVEVVCDAARHLTERGEALGLVHLGLHLSLGGGVADDREDAGAPAVPRGQEREGHRKVQGPPVRALGAHIESADRSLRGEGGPLDLIGLLGEQAREGTADRLARGYGEDAFRGGVPPAHEALTVDRDDRVARAADQLLEILLGLGHLAVQARIADRDRQIVGEHLQQLALTWIDGPGRRAVGHQEVAEDVALFADGADQAGLARDVGGNLGAEAHGGLVVAQGVLEQLGDGAGELAEVELTEQAAGDLAQDRQLGDPQGLLGVLPAGLLLQAPRLGGQRAHLLHQRGELLAGPEAVLASGEGPLRGLFQILPAERLDEVLEGAVGQRVLHRLEGGVGGDHHHLDARVRALDPPEQLDAVHLRHLDVHEDQIRMEGVERLEGGLAAVGGGDLVARLEDHAEGLARSHLVVDHQYPRTVAHACPDAGSEAVKLTSFRACLASSRPPWLSRIR